MADTDNTTPRRFQDAVTFAKGIFSESDGTPSSSRILTFILAMGSLIILFGLFRHTCKLTDAVALGLWLGNIPMIIASLVAFMAAPYTINRASGSISDIIGALRRKE